MQITMLKKREVINNETFLKVRFFIFFVKRNLSFWVIETFCYIAVGNYSIVNLKALYYDCMDCNNWSARSCFCNKGYGKAFSQEAQCGVSPRHFHKKTLETLCQPFQAPWRYWGLKYKYSGCLLKCVNKHYILV